MLSVKNYALYWLEPVSECSTWSIRMRGTIWTNNMNDGL